MKENKVKFVHVDGGYSFSRGLDEAKKSLGYYREGLFLEISSQIIAAMKEAGLSRVEMARRLDVSPAFITKVLRGHANMTLETLSKIAFALDLKWACILMPQSAEIGLFSLTARKGKQQLRQDVSLPVCKKREVIHRKATVGGGEPHR